MKMASPQMLIDFKLKKKHFECQQNECPHIEKCLTSCLFDIQRGQGMRYYFIPVHYITSSPKLYSESTGISPLK